MRLDNHIKMWRRKKENETWRKLDCTKDAQNCFRWCRPGLCKFRWNFQGIETGPNECECCDKLLNYCLRAQYLKMPQNSLKYSRALNTACKRRYISRAATELVLECSLLLLVSVWCMWDLKTCGNDPWRSFWKVTRNLVCSSTWWKPYCMLLCLLWTVEHSKRKSRFGMVVSTTLKNHGVLPRALPASPSLSLSHSLSLSLSLSLLPTFYTFKTRSLWVETCNYIHFEKFAQKRT